MDTYLQGLFDTISKTSTEQGGGADVIDTAIGNLVQNKIHPHLIFRFIGKMQYRIYNTD